MEVTWPSHGKLKMKFTAVGPYFRAEQSNEQRYFFDCLAACLSAKPSAEEREFYGWWMELRPLEAGFEYVYRFGLYNKQGEWEEKNIPNKHQKEVQASLDEFYKKLIELLDQFPLELQADAALSPKQHLPAA